MDIKEGVVVGVEIAVDDDDDVEDEDEEEEEEEDDDDGVVNDLFGTRS